MRIPVTVLSIASLAGTVWAGDLSGSGIVVLDHSADGALTMVGNSDVEIPAKAVYVNSCAEQAVKTTGNAALNCPNLYVMGGTSFGGRSGCSGVISHPPVAYDDPMSNTIFPVSDGMPAQSAGSGDVTLQPGYYAAGISVTGNAAVTLMPGIYVLGGDLKVTSGSISGSGVCIVMQSGSVNIAGVTSLVLTPPSSGSMAGIVMAQPSSNTSDLSLAGGSGVDIGGTIYAPKAMITLTGSSTVTGQGPMMGDLVISKTMKIAGNGTVRIGHANFAAVQLPSVPLYD